MFRLAAAAAALVLSLTSAPAHAADPVVVVELYTSQGCSSCPPADKLLGELAGRKDVLPLALHVDYWDYIGWADKFANPAHTKRQRAYARVAGSRSIYTPQMIVGGKDHVIGYKPMAVADAIQANRKLVPIEIGMVRSGNSIVISAQPQGRLPSDMQIQLVRYAPRQSVKIERGENAGKTIKYHNIVLDWSVVGKWDGRAPYRAEVSAPADGKYAVIIQRRGPGPVIAAARLN
ncbi:MAG: DUF1223 domain-containing protein [Rhodobacteraceae bacterium]|nr:DUF1223 domain-containing protein [Paracoccaceae bacterium]